MDRLSRLTPVPIVMRSLVFVCAMAGLTIAAPDRYLSAQILAGFAVIALFPALSPGGRSVSVALGAIVGLWVMSTLVTGEPETAGRTFAVGCALYVTHSAAALAAVLPHDAVVDISVPLRWAARATLVVLGAMVITAFVVWVTPGLTPTTSTFAIIAGLGIVALVVWVIARSSRRVT